MIMHILCVWLCTHVRSRSWQAASLRLLDLASNSVLVGAGTHLRGFVALKAIV